MNMQTFLSGNELISVIGNALLHSLWQSVVAGIVLMLVFSFLKSASARVHYTIALIGLLVLLLLPVLNFYHFSNPVHFDTPGLSSTEAGLPVSNAVSEKMTTTEMEVNTTLFAQLNASLAWFSPYMFWFWLCGLVVMVLYNAGGFYTNWRMAKYHTLNAAEKWQLKLDKIARQMQIHQKVQLKLSAKILVPFTKGFFKPVIILPISILSQLPVNQIEIILAHELAHIKRRDYLVNLFQIVAESVLFFNPVVWWLSAKIRREREHAADDLSLSHDSHKIDLAKALANLVALSKQNELSNNVICFNKFSTMKRIERLFSQPKKKFNYFERLAVAGFLFAVLMLTGSGGTIADPAASIMKLPDEVTNLEHSLNQPDTLVAIVKKPAKEVETEVEVFVSANDSIAFDAESSFDIVLDEDQNYVFITMTGDSFGGYSGDYDIDVDFDFPHEQFQIVQNFDTIIVSGGRMKADSLKIQLKIEEMMQKVDRKYFQADSLREMAKKIKFKADILADSVYKVMLVRTPEYIDSLVSTIQWKEVSETAEQYAKELEKQLRVVELELQKLEPPMRPDKPYDWPNDSYVPAFDKRNQYHKLLRKELIEKGTIDKGDQMILSKKQLIINGKVVDRKTQKSVLKRYEEISGSTVKSDTAIIID